jgi:hypothetical protein
VNSWLNLSAYLHIGDGLARHRKEWLSLAGTGCLDRQYYPARARGDDQSSADFGRIMDALAMRLCYAVGIRIGNKADQMVEAEDTLIAALKIKTPGSTYVRRRIASCATRTASVRRSTHTCHWFAV